MYHKIVVLKIVPDTINGGAQSVTLGFFDEKGILQLEVPQISGKLLPVNVVVNKEVIFNSPVKIFPLQNKQM